MREDSALSDASSRNSARTWGETSGMSALPSTLRSAVIIASGSEVSSTAPASARNSRLRDSAMRSTAPSPQARAISNRPISAALPLLRELEPDPDCEPPEELLP